MLYCPLYCNSKCCFSSSGAYWQNLPQEVLYKKDVLTNSSKFTRKYVCQSVFFKRLYYRFFPVNFPKFVRPLFLQNAFGRLLLYLEPCQISMIELFCGSTEAVAQRCSLKGVLRNFTKFTGKHLCQSLFFYKVAGLRPATLLKKRL